MECRVGSRAASAHCSSPPQYPAGSPQTQRTSAPACTFLGQAEVDHSYGSNLLGVKNPAGVFGSILRYDLPPVKFVEFGRLDLLTLRLGE